MKIAAAKEGTLFYISDNLRDNLYCEKLTSNVQQQIILLNPICEFIDFVQAANCTLAEGVAKWLSLEPVKNFEKHHIIRTKMVLTKPGRIAYMLHPKFKGEKLDKDFMGTKFLIMKMLDIEGQNKFLEFMGGIGPVFGENILKSLNYISYWNAVIEYCPGLGEIAKKYLSLPASTASLERIFSQWSFVHNKTRNRLASDKSEKLIHVYNSLKFSDKPSLDY